MSMLDSRVWRVTTYLTALVMLTAPAAMATHNSLGSDATLTEATEYDPETGDLARDVGENLRKDYHGDAASTSQSVQPGDIPVPRPAPRDQSGLNYNPATGCTPHGADNGAYEDELDDIEAAVDDWRNAEDRVDTDLCYVGFLDMRHQYVWGSSWSGSWGSDPLYSVNPTPTDGYCNGADETNEHTGVGPVDEAVTNAERVNDDDCDGSSHSTYTPGYKALSIDMSLMETPVQETAGEVMLDDQGSGTATMPNLLVRYVYLFGQPHPAVDSDDFEGNTRLEAGSGPFGPNPAEGGDPIRDISNACGDRTQECKLLTPQDIRAWDDDPPSEEEDTARVCTYQPSYFTVNPGEITTTPCGSSSGTGSNIVGNYISRAEAGGLGVEEAPSTYLAVTPGWHGTAWLLNHRSSTWAADYGCDDGTLCHDYLTDENVYQTSGAGFFTAVNPQVPEMGTETGQLWCALPNILATGEGFQDPDYAEEDWIAASDDPGFYGQYLADAIDADVHRHVLDNVAKDVRDATHDEVRMVVGPAQEVLPPRSELINPETLNDPLQVVTWEDIKDQAKEHTGQDAAIERADYLGSSSHDPAWDEHRLFSSSFDEGLGCHPDGFPQFFEDPDTLPGALNFDAGVSNSGTTSIKDPTVLDEDGLPAREDETYEGAWQADTYSFGGQAVAHVDTVTDFDDGATIEEKHEDASFDECALALGQPQPDRDDCVWRGVWDAYNEDCVVEENDDGPDELCGDLLRDRGYDVDGEGVGVFYTLKVTGPMAVYDVTTDEETFQERFRLLGIENPMAQNCVVGTSIGFAEKLPNHVAGSDPVNDTLCADADGDTAFLGDSFNDGSDTGGSFSSAVNFAKLAPTPDELQSDGFGEDDELCMHGVWSVQEGVTSTTDTEENLRLGAGVHHYTWCVPLASE